MNEERRDNLLLSSYKNFRIYLDTVYSTKTEKEVLGLSTGYPPAGLFPLPKVILKKLASELNGDEKPRPGYGWEAGSQSVREILIRYENKVHGLSYSMENISIVAGATYGLNRIFEYIFESSSNKELLIVAPTFYRMLGRVDRFADVRSISGEEQNDFQITSEKLLESLSVKTKAVFILNPSNPAFRYYDNDFFQKVIPELEKRKIYLIIDESGDGFYHGTARFRRFPKIIQSPNVIRIVTASKKFLLAEYRIGYVLADHSFIGNKENGFIKLVGDDMSNPPLAANDAWESLVSHDIQSLENQTCQEKDCDYKEVMEKNLHHLKQLKEHALHSLESNPYIERIIQPEASFNLLFKIRGVSYQKDIDLFRDLIHQTGVSLVPGSGFGIPEHQLYYRLTYAIDDGTLKRGLESLFAFIKAAKND